VICGRVWEAEALEDGRLDVSSMASFDRHARACADCASVRAELAALREVGLRLEPRRLSPFEHRRRRAELLRRANDQAVRPPRRRNQLILAAAAAVAIGFVGIRFWHAFGVPLRSASRPRPVFEARALGSATFHDRSSGTVGRIVLSDGTLALHVEHLTGHQRFVRGTRFIVEASGGRTARVLVAEGVVALRITGAPERTLSAGDSYAAQPAALARERPATAEAAVSTQRPPDPGSRANAPRERITRPSGASGTRRAPQPFPGAEPPSYAAGGAPGALAAEASATPRAAAAPAEVAASAGERRAETVFAEAAGDAFHTAMAAFSLGSYAEADARFAAFVERFAGDSHSEDAAFLRTVIALRLGDPGAAVARGRSYLRRFPFGLRRTEVERMIETAERAGTTPAPPAAERLHPR
jgi:hypothetical protein